MSYTHMFYVMAIKEIIINLLLVGLVGNTVD
jgi:hypothetical protein